MTDAAVSLSITIKLGNVSMEMEGQVQREEVEGCLGRLVRGVGQRVLGGVIQVLDDQLAQEVPAGWRNVGTEARWMVSSLGTIRYRRRIYVDEQEQRRKPVDELFGLQRYGRLSGRVQEIGASLASQATYRLAAEQLSYLTGTEIGPSSLQRMVWAIGERIEAGEEAQRRRVFEGGEELEDGQVDAPVLYGESDGVWIHLQQEAKRSAEVRLAVLSTGRSGVGKDRYRLENKHWMTALEVDGLSWQEQILQEAHLTYDLKTTQVLISGGDGNRWVRHSFDRLELPQYFVLDRFHLQRAARRALGKGQKATEVVSRMRQAGFQAVSEELRECIQKAEGKPREQLLQFYQYVFHNQDGLVDLQYRGVLVEPCLGAIEGNVDKLVVHRMKGRGCSWRLRGARAMLALCRHTKELLSQAYRYLPLSTPPRTYRETQILEVEYEQTVHGSMPIFSGPDQNKPWVRRLHEWLYGR